MQCFSLHNQDTLPRPSIAPCFLTCSAFAPRPPAQGPKAVLGPGTGLGEAQLFWDDATGNYKVHASGERMGSLLGNAKWRLGYRCG